MDISTVANTPFGRPANVNNASQVGVVQIFIFLLYLGRNPLFEADSVDVYIVNETALHLLSRWLEENLKRRNWRFTDVLLCILCGCACLTLSDQFSVMLISNSDTRIIQPIFLTYRRASPDAPPSQLVVSLLYCLRFYCFVQDLSELFDYSLS